MIRESIKELAKTAHKLTLEEWNNLTLNTYERNYLYEYLPNYVLIEVCKRHNQNVEVPRAPTTYNEAVVAILFPELIRRLEDLYTHRSTNDKYKQAIKTFLNDSSWTQYCDRVRAIEMNGIGFSGVSMGTEVFQALANTLHDEQS
jgi:hypothetical protein